MTPETAAAIARRIGMRYVKAVDGTRSHWRDGETWVYPELDSLSDYLATGDRPLRVMESIKPTYNIEITCDDDRWRIWIHPDKYAEAETLAAAILECAAALEEGNE